MAGGGLRAARDALVTANAYDLIDDDEFVLLYYSHSSKAIFPYWKFPKFDADAWSEFIHFKSQLRINMSAVEKFYIVCALLSVQFMQVGSLAGVTYLRYTALSSPKKGETAVRCCDPALSVLVMLVSRNVFHVVSALQPVVCPKIRNPECGIQIL